MSATCHPTNNQEDNQWEAGQADPATSCSLRGAATRLRVFPGSWAGSLRSPWAWLEIWRRRGLEAEHLTEVWSTNRERAPAQQAKTSHQSQSWVSVCFSLMWDDLWKFSDIWSVAVFFLTHPVSREIIYCRGKHSFVSWHLWKHQPFAERSQVVLMMACCQTGLLQPVVVQAGMNSMLLSCVSACVCDSRSPDSFI